MMRHASLLFLLVGCSKQPPSYDPLTGGNPRTGLQLVARYGCPACHEIEGIAHAGSKVGPPLTEIRERGHVGAAPPNSAGNLVMWIVHPRAYSPNMAAYLYNE